jgi:hypothetical protein
MTAPRSCQLLAMAMRLTPRLRYMFVPALLTLTTRSAAAQPGSRHYCGTQISTSPDVLPTLTVWHWDGACNGTLPPAFGKMTSTAQRTALAGLIATNAGTAGPTTQRRRCDSAVPACTGTVPTAYVNANILPINDVYKVRPAALPVDGVVIGSVINVTAVVPTGTKPRLVFDTLTGAGAYGGGANEETYIVVHKEKVVGSVGGNPRRVVDSMYSASVEFRTYVPVPSSPRWRLAGVKTGTFGLCEVFHGPWTVAAADFWTCDHAHSHLRCLSVHADSVRSAASLYYALRNPPDTSCFKPADDADDSGDAPPPTHRAERSLFHQVAFRQASPFQTAAPSGRSFSYGPGEAFAWLRRSARFQSDDDPGWTTCALGCCAVYR